MCPSSQYPVLKVHAVRLIRSDRAARQGDILPDRRGAGGGNLGVHISYTVWDSQLYLAVIKRVFQVPWTILETKDWPEHTMEQLRKMGYHTVAMALKEDSLRPDDEKLHNVEKLAIILGTEGEGLAADTIADCDDTVCIPMAHGVDSLNVAAASAVAFWELCK